MSDCWTTTDHVSGGSYTIATSSNTIPNTMTFSYHVDCREGHVADNEAVEYSGGKFFTRCQSCRCVIELPRLASGFQALRASDLMARILCGEDTPDDLALYAELRVALLHEQERVEDALTILGVAARTLRERL